MTFPYPLFPVSMAFGFNSTFDYGNGELMVTNAGAVVAGPTRATAQHTFDFSYSIRDRIDVDAITDVIHDVRLNVRPILIRDWADFEATNGELGTGDGSSDPKILYKFYGATNPVARRIKYPDPDDLLVFEDGSPKAIASVDANGVVPVTPWTPYATLTWSGSFYVPVRLQSFGSVQIDGPQGRYASLPRLAAIEDLAA